MTRARWALKTAIVPWLVSRVVVLCALAVARELVSDGRLTGRSASVVHEGLLAWDAGWYEAIAAHGYGGAGNGALRFFPLVPAMARGLSYFPGLSVGAALLVISNVASLGAAALLCVLVRSETSSSETARRSAWLLCLAPPAFTFAMGYAESTFIFLSIAAFLFMRRRRFGIAACFCLLAALARPLGAFLFLPAVVECWRSWYSPDSYGGWSRDRSRSRSVRRLGALACILAGPAGCGAFLGWAGWRYGDAFAPLRIEQEAGHRGPVADPLRTMGHDLSLLVHGDHLGTAFHLPWVLLALALLVVCAARLPASYTAFAFCVLGVALTASNLDSFERYSLSAFPLVMAAAGLLRSPKSEVVVYVVAATGMVAYAILAFTGLYVP